MIEMLPRPSLLLDPARVLLDLDMRSKKRVFEEVGLAFENSGGPARNDVFRHLLERERLGSTLIADGVALPHARIAGLNKPISVFVRMAAAFPFDSPEAQAKLLFVTLVPDKADASHLQILSIMSRMLTDAELVAELEKAPDAEALIVTLQAWEVRSLDKALRP
ncbi:MAG: PTS sugar transporter subunit IIA [Betaproteobacteria bacterium]|nr:PTS sugar transporter subunit IIA [Betaproteobacteria bacterium]